MPWITFKINNVTTEKFVVSEFEFDLNLLLITSWSIYKQEIALQFAMILLFKYHRSISSEYKEYIKLNHINLTET